MHRHRVVTVCVVLALLVLFGTPLLTRAPYIAVIDGGTWGGDAQKLSGCIRSGEFPCGTARISKYPAAYLINSSYLSAMGTRGFTPARAIGLLNTLILTLPIVFIVFIRGLHASLARSFVYILSILLSALPPFYISGALEVQSGVFIGIFLSSLVLMQENLGQPCQAVLALSLFMTALLLSLHKDINFLVLFVGLAVVGTTAWRNYSKGQDPMMVRWRRTAWCLVIALGVAFRDLMLV